MDVSVEVHCAGEGHKFACSQGERLLYAGLRHGLRLPYECATGTCGGCRATVTSGTVTSLWPDAPASGILRKGNQALLCQSTATGACTIEVPPIKHSYPREVPRYLTGVISEIVPGEDGLAWVQVELDMPISFLPGQFVLISMPGVDGYRAYSPTQAGQPTSRLSFTVRHKDGGALSPRLCSHTSVATSVGIFGPLGSAHVRPDEDGDMTLIVGGSGSAIALSVLDWAATSGHLTRHNLDIVCGLRTSRCSEITRRLAAFAKQFPNRLRIALAVSDEPAPAQAYLEPRGFEIETGLAHEVAARRLTQAWRDRTVFVAGPPPMVQSTLRMLVLAKVSPQRIRYDSFS